MKAKPYLLRITSVLYDTQHNNYNANVRRNCLGQILFGRDLIILALLMKVNNRNTSRDGSRTATASKMERFVIIVNGYYHKALRLGCCSSPRSASVPLEFLVLLLYLSCSQSPGEILVKSCSENFAKLAGNHLCRSHCLIRLHSVGTFFIKKLRNRCFLESFVKLLRAAFLLTYVSAPTTQKRQNSLIATRGLRLKV